MLLLGNFCEILFIRCSHPKWAHSIAIPGNQRHSVDHKKVKTMWFHTCSRGNACSEL